MLNDAADNVACCLPKPPCGRVVCSSAATIEQCKELAKVAARVSTDLTSCYANSASASSSAALRRRRRSQPSDHAEPSLPCWEDVIYPFFLIPFATLISITLLWLVLQVVYKRAMYSHGFLHRLMLNRIGCTDHPYPQNPRFMAGMFVLQIIASLWTMGIFVFNSYQRKILPIVKWMEIGLGFFLSFHYLIMGLRNEFSVLQLLSLGQLVDVITIPNMLLLLGKFEFCKVHWLSLNFLRSIQATLAYEKLDQLGSARWSTHELTHEFTLMALRFFSIVVCFASLVLVLEILGEVTFLKEVLVDTAMGNISFFTMMYWIIETISTVGYGDFTPKTFPSRIVTMLCMVSGVAFLTFELDKIVGIINRQKKGYESYPLTTRKHVVLVGGGVRHADETVVVAFIDELFHATYRNNWPNLIVMTTEASHLQKMREMFEANLDFQARQQVFYLIGSPLNVSDMKRCRCETAILVFIIADTTGSIDPFEEDKENILRALSVKNGFPHTPLRLMLLLPESKEKALSVGIRPQRCFSVNEMKSNLFWQSCRCRGWHTLLCNVVMTTEASDASLVSTKWMKDYLHGMGTEVYGMLPAEKFHGKRYQDVVCEAYERHGVCIFAAQIDGAIELAPMKHGRTVQPDQVFFCLAQDIEEMTGIVDSKKDWKEVFLAKRLAMFKAVDKEEEDLIHYNFLHSASELTREKTFCADLSPDLTAEITDTSKAPLLKGEGSEPGSPISNKVDIPPLLLPHRRGRHASTLTLSASASMEWGDAGGKSHGLTKSRSLGRIASFGSPDDEAIDDEFQEQLEEQATRIVKNAPTAPFLLLLDISGSWKQVIPFVEQNRSHFLPFRLPIVVLGPLAPTEKIAKRLELKNDSLVGWVLGSANWAPDLVKSGVRESSIIVCLGQDIEAGSCHFSDELTAMLDADVVMLQRMLGRLGVSEKSMIFEFKRRQNMRLLPAIEEHDGDDHFPRQCSDQCYQSGDAMPKASAGHIKDVTELDDGTRMLKVIVPTQTNPRELTGEFDSDGGSEVRSRNGDRADARDLKRDAIEMVPTASPRIRASSIIGASVLDRWRQSFTRRNPSYDQLVSTESIKDDPGLDLGAPVEEAKDYFICDPRFASGQIFTPQVLGALLARAFHTPGIVEVMQLLVTPTNNDGGVAYLPWQIRPRICDIGRTYLQMLKSLVQDSRNPAVPLGIFRCFDPHSNSSKGFVWTNPVRETEILRSDLIYVLGDTQFGQWACNQGLLPLSGKQKIG